MLSLPSELSPSKSRLSFTIDANNLLGNVNFLKTNLRAFNRKDRQLVDLQITTLRGQFAQIRLTSNKGDEVSSTWEALKSSTVKLTLEAGNVYLNGRRLLFQSSFTQSEVEEQSESPALPAEKPQEWNEIEEFLSAEIDEPVSLNWPVEEAQVQSVREQVFLNQVDLPNLPFKAFDYLVFDEEVISEVHLHHQKSLSERISQLVDRVPRPHVSHEQLLMAAVVGGFVAYLLVLIHLARMTTPNKKKVKVEPPVATTILKTNEKPIQSTPSQTKSTDVLRPVSYATRKAFYSFFLDFTH